jgi:methanogenic corrinoid protein MtbC1
LSLSDANAIQERIINDLLQAMVDLDMEWFEKILNNHIAAKGIERTVTQIIFPFLEKIGILWLTGHINPAQEHLVSNIIRQKIIVAIDKQVTSPVAQRSVLLFLPESEHHELGLLFMNFILKKLGYKTIYLGADIAFQDTASVIQLKKPDFVFTHLTAAVSNFCIEKFLRNIQQHFGPVKTIVSGPVVQQYKKKTPAGIDFKQSLAEVMDFFSAV